MAFFTSTAGVLQTLAVALGAGSGKSIQKHLKLCFA